MYYFHFKWTHSKVEKFITVEKGWTRNNKKKCESFYIDLFILEKIQNCIEIIYKLNILLIIIMILRTFNARFHNVFDKRI